MNKQHEIPEAPGDGVARASWATCDTSGCLNKATVHYGLEEWYCDKCDKVNNGRC